MATVTGTTSKFVAGSRTCGETTRTRQAAASLGLHWAGAETSDVWNGYMDGAVRSGRRAADEILAELA